MSGRGAVTGRPNSDAVPADGFVRPAITLSRVDFPQPEGPTMETNSPGATSKDTSRNAVTRVRRAVNRTDTCSMVTAAEPSPSGREAASGRNLVRVVISRLRGKAGVPVLAGGAGVLEHAGPGERVDGRLPVFGGVDAGRRGPG